MAKSITKIFLALSFALHTQGYGEEHQTIIGPGQIYSIELPPSLKKSYGGCDLTAAHPTEKILFKLSFPRSVDEPIFGDVLSNYLSNIDLNIWLAGYPFLKKIKDKYAVSGKNWQGSAIEFQGKNPANQGDMSLIYVEAANSDTKTVLGLFASTASLKANEGMLRGAIKSLRIENPDVPHTNPQRESGSQRVTSLDRVLSIELPTQQWESWSSCDLSVGNNDMTIAINIDTYPLKSSSISIDEVANHGFSSLRKRSPFLVETKSKYKVTGKNWWGYATEYRGTDPHRIKRMYAIDLSTIRGGNGVHMKLYASDVKFSENEVLLRNMIHSLLF